MIEESELEHRTIASGVPRPFLTAELFGEANAFPGSADRYKTVLIAARRNPLRASNGIRTVA